MLSTRVVTVILKIALFDLLTFTVPLKVICERGALDQKIRNNSKYHCAKFHAFFQRGNGNLKNCL